MEIEPNYDTIALQLLTLLSQNLLGEFHTEIESLHPEAYGNENITKVIAMEQYFIEGRYNKVMEMISTLKLGDISALLPSLRQTIIDAVAQTIQTAYESLPLDYARKVLMITSQDELTAIINQYGWKLENERIVFTVPGNDKKKGTKQVTNEVENERS